MGTAGYDPHQSPDQPWPANLLKTNNMNPPGTRSATAADVPAAIALQKRVCPGIGSWSPARLLGQLQVFAQAQVVAETDAGLVGYAGSLVARWADWAEEHSWQEITGAGTFEHHDPAAARCTVPRCLSTPRCRSVAWAICSTRPGARGVGR